jgi:hypothetical protein
VDLDLCRLFLVSTLWRLFLTTDKWGIYLLVWLLCGSVGWDCCSVLDGGCGVVVKTFVSWALLSSETEGLRLVRSSVSKG